MHLPRTMWWFGYSECSRPFCSLHWRFSLILLLHQKPCICNKLQLVFEIHAMSIERLCAWNVGDNLKQQEIYVFAFQYECSCGFMEPNSLPRGQQMCRRIYLNNQKKVTSTGTGQKQTVISVSQVNTSLCRLWNSGCAWPCIHNTQAKHWTWLRHSCILTSLLAARWELKWAVHMSLRAQLRKTAKGPLQEGYLEDI